MEELGDEFMILGPHKDPATVEAVVVAACKDLLWERPLLIQPSNY